jgi:hypothetical protein
MTRVNLSSTYLSSVNSALANTASAAKIRNLISSNLIPWESQNHGDLNVVSLAVTQAQAYLHESTPDVTNALNQIDAAFAQINSPNCIGRITTYSQPELNTIYNDLTMLAS